MPYLDHFMTRLFFIAIDLKRETVDHAGHLSSPLLSLGPFSSFFFFSHPTRANACVKVKR